MVIRDLLGCPACGGQYVRTVTRRTARANERAELTAGPNRRARTLEQLERLVDVAAAHPDASGPELVDLIRTELSVSRTHAYRLLRDARLRRLIPPKETPDA